MKKLMLFVMISSFIFSSCSGSAVEQDSFEADSSVKEVSLSLEPTETPEIILDSEPISKEILETAASTYTISDLIILNDPYIYTYDDMIHDSNVLSDVYGELVRTDIIGQTADGRQILDFVIGKPDASREIFVNAGIHAREYLTSQLVMKEMAVYLEHVKNNDYYEETSYGEMWQNCIIHVVPMCNPDGITISQFGIDGLWNEDIRDGIYEIAAMDGMEVTPSYLETWKANASGVDLNRQFDAYWDEYVDPVGHPSADHYKGAYPGSEPESAALIDLTVNHSFLYTISYHTQGQLIYWQFANMDAIYDRAYAWATQISAATGYPLQDDYSVVDPAGYSDWGIYRCQIPSLTIEVALGVSPYLQEQFQQVWQENMNVWEITVMCALND